MVIISVFNFNIFENPEPLKLYLCKPNRKIICCLNGIDNETASISVNLNNQYELSFQYDKYITIDDKQVKSNGYDYLNIGMEIFVEKIGIFKMKYPPRKYDGDKEYKSITASSIDCELENKDLNGFKINTGEKDSLEYLVTYDDDETESLINDYTGLPYDYIVFYNTYPEQLNSYLNKYSDGIINDVDAIKDIDSLCKLIPRLKNKLINNDGHVSLEEYVIYTYDSNNNITQLELVNFNERIQTLITFYTKYRKQLSLIDLAIEKCNCNWDIGSIDNLLCNKKFSFSVDNKNIYSFLTQDIPNSANCIVMFDIFSKKINIKLIDNLGNNTGIFLTKRNLLNTLEVSCDDNSLYTRYNVSGGDDLDINYVNFGTSRIDDITYYLYAKDDNGKHMYMSESLVNKYLQYMSDRELARNKYIELTKQYNQIVVDINNLEYLVPNDYLSNDWGSYTMDELEGLLVSFKNMLCTLKSLYKEEYKDIGLNPDGSINEDYIKTTIYWHDYYAYINIINQIEIAIDVYASNSNYNDIDDANIIKQIYAYKTEWSLYGTIELQNKIDAYNNTMKAMIDGELIILKDDTTKEPYKWNELTNAQKREFNNEEFNYKYDEYYEIWSNRKSCNEYLQTQLTKVNDLKSQLSDIQTARKNIQRVIPIEYYDRELLSTYVDLPLLDNVDMYTFTDDEIQTINLLYIDKSYNNNNLFVTSLNTLVDTIDVEQELLTDAMDKLSIDSQPQIIVSGDIDNFFAIKDFEKIQEWFELGNYINVEYFDDYFVKLRLVEYSFNPCIPSDKLNISFSNYIKSKSKRSDITYLLGSNGSSSSSSSGSSGSGSGSGNFGSDDLNISNTMLSKLLNTEMFGTRVTDVILDTIDVNALTAKSAKFGNLYNGTTTINGKCITTGYITDTLYNGLNGSINNDKGSIINLEDGKFNFGGGSLTWDGADLNLKGYITALGGHIGGLTLDSECLFLPDGNGDGGAINNGLVYLGKNGFSLGGNKLVYNALTNILTFGEDVKLTWDNINDADTFVTQITQNTIQTMEITANKLNIDEINANNGLTGLKLAGFTVTDTSLYNLKESLASNDIGCYIGTDGIAYSGSERHFKVNSSGDVVSDAIYSSDGVQLLCHNTSYTSNPNGNVVLAYGNANETNIYGNIIRLVPSPDETDYDYFILIQKGLIAPYLDSTYNLGNVTHKWSKIYCDELICTTVTSENGGSSSGGVSSGDTVSNITITGKNNYLKDGILYLGNVGSIIETYYINSDGNAKFNSCNIVDLNVTGSATLPTLSNITITGKNNYLKDGILYLGTSSSNYYLNGDGNGSFVNLYYNTLTQNSSKRFKENIDYKDDTYWHDKLMGIKPCTFNYKNNEKERIGVIAEDLYETFPELVQKDSDGLVSSVSYVDMIVPLVSEVQRLNNVITKQQNEIDELKSLIS